MWVCWTGRLILCDMGQAGGVEGDGEYGLSGQRGIHLSVPMGPICMSVPFVCVSACSHMIRLLNNMSLLA